MTKITATISMFTKPAKKFSMINETPKLAAPIKKRNVRERPVVLVKIYSSDVF
jgi:hypothetical protein